MKLVFLGTSGYHNTDQRQTACLMLPEIGLVFDAGSAFYRVRDWLQTSELNVFLTHAHLDHCIGLTYLFTVLHQRNVRVIVHGDAAKLQSIREHLFHRDLFPVMPPLHWQPLPEAPMDLAGGRLSWWQQRHPGGSLGFRLDGENRSIAIVTDTMADPAADYVEQIRGVDLLIHECTLPDGYEALAEKTGHSCLTPIAQVAKAASVQRLVLTHIDPTVDREQMIDLQVARAIFPRTEMASDNLVIEL